MTPTWREIGVKMCWQRSHDHDRYESLPDPARWTLAQYRQDRRAWVYSLADLDAGRTPDPLWNAAQSLTSRRRMESELSNCMEVKV